MKHPIIRLALVFFFAGQLSSVALTFDDWMATHPDVPADQRGKTDTPAGDGIANLIKFYLADMEPMRSERARLPEPTKEAGMFLQTFARRAGVEGVDAGFERLVAGDWVTVTDGVSETPESLSLALPLDGSPMIVRLRLDTASLVIGNNPITARYPGLYEWTDIIDWDNEFDVLDFGAVADGDFALSTGTDNTAAFHAAIDAAHAAGGGVVRIPAGVYYIADHLILRDGVVLRGDTPAPGADTALDDTFDPPSKLVFPRFEFNPFDPAPIRGGPGEGFKRIFTEFPLTDSRQGLVWLDINRAAIILDTLTNPIGEDELGDWRGKGDDMLLGVQGTHRVVFGVRNNNAALAWGAEGTPIRNVTPREWQHPWQVWPYPFNANVRIAGAGHVIVANCRINDMSAQNTWAWGRDGEPDPVYVDDSFDQIGYLAEHNATPRGPFALNRTGQATFRHSNQYGISLNGLFMFAKAGRGGAPADPDGNPNGWHASPTSAPWMFYPGHTIRDNFIYSTAGQQIEASGDGLEIIGNVTRDALNKTAFVGAAGNRAPSNGSAFLSRGMLVAGSNHVIEHNDVRTTRHNIGHPNTGNVTTFVSNDGEGIMIDNTGSRVNGWTVRHNRVNSNIFMYEPREIRNVIVSDNTFDFEGINNTSGGHSFWFTTQSIANHPSTFVYALENVLVERNTNMRGTFFILGSNDSTDVIVRDNESDGPTRTLSYWPSTIILENNTGFNEVLRQ